MGVSLEELRAALGERGEVGWSAAEWERLWLTLSGTQQRVVFARVLLGLPPSAAARRAGLGRGAADGAWRRALDRIRAALPG